MPSTILKLVLAGAAAAAISLPSASEVITDRAPDGYSFDREQLDLDFAAYRDHSPDYVGHVDPAGVVAAEMNAAVRRWYVEELEGTYDESVIVLEVTVWATELDAARFVDAVARDAAASGRDAYDSAFPDVLEFGRLGEEGATQRSTTWRQGRYGVVVDSLDVDGGDASDEVVATQREAITVALAQADYEESGSTGIGTFLVWVAVVMAAIFGLSILGVRRSMTRRHAGRSPDRV